MRSWERNRRYLQCPETDSETTQVMADALRNCEPFKVNIINQHKNGTNYWVEVEVQPIRDDDGTVTNFIGLQRDISEQRNQAEAIQQANQLLSQLFDALNNPILLEDENRCVQRCNQAFCDWFVPAVSPREQRAWIVPGLTVNGLFIDGDDFLEQTMSALEGGMPSQQDIPFRFGSHLRTFLYTFVRR